MTPNLARAVDGRRARASEEAESGIVDDRLRLIFTCYEEALLLTENTIERDFLTARLQQLDPT